MWKIHRKQPKDQGDKIMERLVEAEFELLGNFRFYGSIFGYNVSLEIGYWIYIA